MTDRRHTTRSIACSAGPLMVPVPDFAQVASLSPPSLNPALAALPGGIALMRSDLLRWIEGAGGSTRDFARADTTAWTEKQCRLVDDLDLGPGHLEMARLIAPQVDRVALWRETLIRAANRDPFAPSNEDDSQRTLLARIAWIEAAMAAIKLRSSIVPINRFVADRRHDAKLVRHSAATRFTIRPTVGDRYRRAFFGQVVQGAAAQLYVYNPATDIDASRAVRARWRAASKRDGQVRLSFATVQRADAHGPIPSRSVKLDSRRRSQGIVIQIAGQPVKRPLFREEES